MKQVLVAIYLCMLSLSYSQEEINGLFLSAADFKSGKLTHTGKHTRIYLHEFRNKNLVKVKTSDSAHVYLKKDLYGYCDKNGLTFRFYNEELFPILNPSEEIVFYKKISGNGLKNSPYTETYFFSKQAGSEVLPLTLRITESVFAEHKEFEKLIELYFKRDSDLIEFDHIHSMYKLNRIFQLSQIPN